MQSVVNNTVHPRKWPQLVACQSATIGIFAAGLVFGWSSSAGQDGENLRYPFDIDSVEFSWISSVGDIGAALICVPTDFLTNVIGRKAVLLALTVLYVIGWACVIWADSITILLLGRLILGASSGAFFVALSVYTAEIADKETRGRLSSFITLFYYAGILAAYILGLLNDMYLQSLISATVPIVFFAIFYFMPESPTYYLVKGNVESAREVLIWLRGAEYDTESELEEKKNGLEEAKRYEGSFLTMIRSSTIRRTLLIGYGLTFFQSFGGSDVILTYVSSIFADATGSDGKLSAIVASAMQLPALFLFSFLVDKWGRRLLLLMSGSVMTLSSLILGGYFYVQETGGSVDRFTWVPLVCISTFLVFFSLGFAAIPWIIGELFPTQIKAVAIKSACAIEWFSVFLVVKFFNQGKSHVGLHGVFWTHSVMNALGTVFIYFLLPETKNKSLEQIQVELNEKCDAEPKCATLLESLCFKRCQ